MATTSSIVGSGAHTFEVLEDWARLPEGWEMPAAAVTVDAQDRVYCFNRSADHPVVVFDRDGRYLSSWGAGLFAFPHTIRTDASGNLWLVDRDHGQMMYFTPDGKLLRTIGTRGYRSDTGVDASEPRSTAYRKITHAGGPFNLPTDIAVAPSGEMFVTDGYGNARVHKFAADGTHLFSWGEPGSGPGQFRLPHAVWIDRHERVMVCDRENDRVQVFDQQGHFLHAWPTRLIGPAVFYVDADDIVYIPEHNGGLVSVLTLDGERLAQWGDPSFRSCHGIWGDSRGDLYVVRPGAWGRDRRVVKYARVR
ncbi:MAG TPA: peptidyl-alpha-hydroxyglycine alpha-amidating lyase family protein [Candidatus Methylomirabilis sp.]|nr:peptidyl-alpha-hydroxyglycine alpha-amidating lyase family protein [Candidatus Methylomirabilis sp.]